MEKLSPEQAKKITCDIQDNVDSLSDLLTQAYEGRAWEALGYDSWASYCKTEFKTQLKLPADERKAFVRALRAAGMSTRAIASATGNSHKTIARDIQAGVSNDTPDPERDPVEIKGLDGKTYQSTNTKTLRVVEELDRPGKLTLEDRPHYKRQTYREIIKEDLYILPDRIEGIMERCSPEIAADVAEDLDEYNEWISVLSKARDDLNLHIQELKRKIRKNEIYE